MYWPHHPKERGGGSRTGTIRFKINSDDLTIISSLECLLFITCNWILVPLKSTFFLISKDNSYISTKQIWIIMIFEPVLSCNIVIWLQIELLQVFIFPLCISTAWTIHMVYKYMSELEKYSCTCILVHYISPLCTTVYHCVTSNTAPMCLHLYVILTSYI